MNRKKYIFWQKVKAFVEKKMRAAWFEHGNCDSCCTNCKYWESHGNVISTKATVPEDGSETRRCKNCGHSWKAIFTPAGFIPLDEFVPPLAKEPQ